MHELLQRAEGSSRKARDRSWLKSFLLNPQDPLACPNEGIRPQMGLEPEKSYSIGRGGRILREMSFLPIPPKGSDVVMWIVLLPA